MSLSVSGSGQMILDELDEKLSDSRVQYIDKKRADKRHHKEVVCTRFTVQDDLDLNVTWIPETVRDDVPDLLGRRQFYSSIRYAVVAFSMEHPGNAAKGSNGIES
jgi:hypothetical protein